MFKKNISILKSTTSLVGTALITSLIFLPSASEATSCTSDCTNNETISSTVNLNSGFYVNNALINASSGKAFIVQNGNVSNITNNGSIIATESSSYSIAIISQSSISGAITNAAGALISGVSGGLGIVNTSTISGGISNSGSIIASNYAVAIDGNITINGGIVNNSTGLISGNEGLYLATATLSGGVSNSGSIIGNGSNGISFESSSSIDGGITNTASGVISGKSTAISINNSYISGGLTNSGSIIAGNAGILIKSSSSVSGGITNNGNISGGIKISNSSVSGGITNNNHSLIYKDGSSALYISHASINGNITNSGSILSDYYNISIYSSMVNGDIINESSGLLENYATNLYLSRSTVNGSITNSGSIIASNNVVSLSHSSVSGGITNSGLISGTNNIISVYDSIVSGGITNSGSIIGSDIAINISNSSYITGGIANTASGVISGGNTGIKIHSSVVSGGITNSGTISGGTNAIYLSSLGNDLDIIISGDNAHVIGNVVDDEYSDGDSIAKISGNFTTQGNWTVSDLTVDSGKTLTISHNDTITLNTMSDSEGTLSFSVLSPEDHAALNVTGGAINLREATVTVNAISATGLADGDEIKIGTGTSSVLGLSDGKNSVTDNSFLYDFKIGDGSNADGGNEDQLYLFVTKNTYTGIAGAIANLSDSESDVVQQTIVNLGNASSDGQQKILETLKPTSDGSSFAASQNISGSVTNITDTRLSSLRDGDPSSGIATGDGANNKNVWAQGFVQKATQDARGGISGYDASTDGVAFGADTGLYNDRIDVGVALGMAKSDIISDSLNATSTNVDSYQISFYSDYRINDRTFIDSSVGYVYGNTKSVKHNIGGTGAYAEGDYDSSQISAQAKLGRDYQLGDTKVTLSTLANYVNYNEDSYTETGNAGPLLLTVNSKELQKFEMGVGADFSWDVRVDNGYVLRPSANIGYRHDFLDDKFSSTATFNGGGTFSTDGLNPANDTLSLGLGLKLLSSDVWNVSVDYGFEAREDYSSHTGTVKVGYKF